MKILSSLYLVRTQETLFDGVELQRRYSKNPFALGDTYLAPFSNKCSRFMYNIWKTNKCKCDTEVFVPVAC